MRDMPRIGGILCAIVLGLLLAGTVAPSTASAHERRDLLGGKYRAVVGFLAEPAYEGQPNGLDLTVTDLTQQTADGKDKPVEGLDKTFKAEVIVGGGVQKLDLTLTPVFNQPGKYAGRFQPTKAGQYSFRIYGEIEGQRIDERFESGPGRFNDVQSLAPLQFPQQLTAPAELQARVAAAEARANVAQTLGIAGLAAGLIGLGPGLAAMVLRRRPAAGVPASRLGGAPTTAKSGEGD